MTTFDFSPPRQDQGNGYPPYNIRTKGEDHYQISMAVAGFAEEDLNITTEQNHLLVTGERKNEEETGEYLHRGIATRSFERRFNLADHVKVVNASLENGLLHIDLERELPEAMKPRTIKIGQSEARLIDVNKEEEAA